MFGQLHQVFSTSSSYDIGFLIQAGGGGGGARRGSGGGAGGLRTSYSSNRSITAESDLELTSGTTYTITVGAAGSAAAIGSNTVAGKGGNSSIAGSGITTITSNGGGGGSSLVSSYASLSAVHNGGSGAGGGGNNACNPNYSGDAVSEFYGSGTSGQGYDGAIGSKTHNGGGGGGGGGGGTKSAGDPGLGCVNNSYGTPSNPGGDGTASSITGSSVTYGTGGTAINGFSGSGSGGSANTGDGGDGNQESGASSVGGYAGGSGVVILRLPTANYSGTTTGSPTVTTSGSDTIIKFTGSGTYTA